MHMHIHLMMHMQAQMQVPHCHCCHCHTWINTNTTGHGTDAHATANSCCPSVEPHPFRSKEHTTASETPDEYTLATDLPGSDPACTHLKR